MHTCILYLTLVGCKIKKNQDISILNHWNNGELLKQSQTDPTVQGGSEKANPTDCCKLTGEMAIAPCTCPVSQIKMEQPKNVISPVCPKNKRLYFQQQCMYVLFIG